eukprot:791512-Amphidinium_carterae.1
MAAKLAAPAVKNVIIVMAIAGLGPNAMPPLTNKTSFPNKSKLLHRKSNMRVARIQPTTSFALPQTHTKDLAQQNKEQYRDHNQFRL